MSLQNREIDIECSLNLDMLAFQLAVMDESTMEAFIARLRHYHKEAQDEKSAGGDREQDGS